MAKKSRYDSGSSKRKRAEPDAESKAEVMGYVLRRLLRFMWLVCTSQVVAAKHRQELGGHYRKLRRWVGDYPRTEQDQTWTELLDHLPKNASFLGWDRSKRLEAWTRRWARALEAATGSFSQRYLGRPWPPSCRPPSADPILDAADDAVALASEACSVEGPARDQDRLASKPPADALKQMADALASYAEYHLDCPLDEWVPGKAIEAFGVVSFRPPEPIEEPLKESAWNDSLVEAERDREVRRIRAAGILRRASTVLFASLTHCGVIRDGEQGPEVDAQLTNRRSEALRTMYRLFGSPEVADRPISLSIEEAKRYADVFDEWRSAWREPPDLSGGFLPLVPAAGPSPDRSKLAASNVRSGFAEPPAIPPLDKDSGEWVTNKVAAGIEGLKTVTLHTYRQRRHAQIHADDGMSGIDRDGRMWRRKGTTARPPWYYRPSLKQTAEKRDRKPGKK